MKSIALILVLATAPTGIETEGGLFDARLQRAQRAEQSAEGSAYRNQLWSSVGAHVSASMQRCFPRDRKADTLSLVLVGDITREGRLQNGEVRPATSMTRCFAQAVGELAFPAPPAAFQDHGMPFAIEMAITP